MTKSLFILMLVGFMISVGFYYDRKAGPQTQTELEAVIGTAVQEPTGNMTTTISGINLEALDRQTRPQDDFYQFANGAWLDSTQIPAIYSGYTVYHQVHEEAEQALRTIIDTAAENRGENGSESQQVGDIYSSWMDEETINVAGIEPVRQELEMVASIKDKASLVQTMAELSRRGISTPFGVSIYPDLKNSSSYAVYFGQSGITMPNRDYFIDTDNDNFTAARDALPAYMASMLRPESEVSSR